jgi:hypothetical protein
MSATLWDSTSEGPLLPQPSSRNKPSMLGLPSPAALPSQVSTLLWRRGYYQRL